MNISFLLLAVLTFHLQACTTVEKKEQADKNTEMTDWSGVWAFNDEYVEYTLTVNEQYPGNYTCVLNATGIQTYYILNCTGKVNVNRLELHFSSVKDGDFLGKERLKKDLPILTLSIENKKVITYWNQLVNNYPDNQNGKECFVRKGN